jgi:cell wall-associated NlpC family hydrolase
MSVRPSNPKRNNLALRMTGGLIIGTILTGGFNLAHAEASESGSSTVAQVAADFAEAPNKTAPGQIKPLSALVSPPGVIKLGVVKPGTVKPGTAKLKTVKPGAVKPGQPAGAPPNAAKPGTVKAILDLAKKQVGIKENSAGGGTQFQKWYVASPRAKETIGGGSTKVYANAAWCDMFVSWLGEKTGAKGIGSDAYTVAHARWFQKQGRWGKTPKPGAVVFFAWNGGGTGGINHVGLVVKPTGNGKIHTIEGNTSNAVLEKQRATNRVVGYGYPQYAN